MYKEEKRNRRYENECREGKGIKLGREKRRLKYN